MADETTPDPAADAPPLHTRRLLPALFLAAVGWYLPFAALSTVLLPARLADLDPQGKTLALGVITASAAVVAVVANIGFGIASDRTRTRGPWIAGGAVASAAVLALGAVTGSVVALGLAWCLFSVALNAYLAPLMAILPDRVPRQGRGRASAVYGSGLIVGQAAGVAAGAAFVETPGIGFLVLPPVLLVAGLAFVLLAPDRAPAPASAGGLRLASTLGALRDGDVRWVLGGRLALVTAVTVVLGFQLYVLTDHVGLDTGRAAQVLVTAGILIGGCALAATVVFGVWSDRAGRRKGPAQLGALILAAAAGTLLVSPTETGFLVFVAVAAIGYGAYQTVDSAIMTEVLPSETDRARDLAVLNLSNAGGQALGPALVPVATAVGGFPAVFVLIGAAGVAAALAITPIRSTI